MKIDVDIVWNMEVKEFFQRLRHIEAIQANDRYILQRQIDNHLKAKNKKTINNFKDIYDEFSNSMDSIGEIKYSNVELTKEEQLEQHKEVLKKMGF